MRLIKDLPIRRKLTLIVMCTTTAALILAACTNGVYDYIALRDEMLHNLSTMANMVAAHSR